MPSLEKVKGSGWDQRFLSEASAFIHSFVQQLEPDRSEKRFSGNSQLVPSKLAPINEIADEGKIDGQQYR